MGCWISILAVLADRDEPLQAIDGFSPAISILAVLADRDFLALPMVTPRLVFQSSRSLRTATGIARQYYDDHPISILAVLADRDSNT